MSATNEFRRLGPGLQIARAETTRVGAGWSDVGQRVERADPTSYLPLAVAPTGLEAPPEAPAPPPPTEAELRTTLSACIASKQFADDRLVEAVATAERAAKHVAACRERLEGFASLDAEAEAALIEALRDAGRGDPDGGPLRQRRIERGIAADDLAAAERAASVLNGAMIDARADADAATVACRRAAVAVCGITAETLAQRTIDLADETERVREVVRGYDQISAGVGALPPTVFQVLVDSPRLARVADTAPWLDACTALMADATATVTIPVPGRVAAPKVVPYSPAITYVQPLRRPEAESEPEASLTVIPVHSDE